MEVESPEPRQQTVESALGADLFQRVSAMIDSEEKTTAEGLKVYKEAAERLTQSKVPVPEALQQRIAAGQAPATAQ